MTAGMTQRVTLTLPYEEIALADVPCQAICPDSPISWEHPCPYRGRYERDGVLLCGHHVARRVVVVEIPDQAARVIRARSPVTMALARKMRQIVEDNV